MIGHMMNHLSSPRKTTLIDDDWKFILGDHQNAMESDFDDSEWRDLDLPHDWSIEGEYAKENPTSTQCGFLPSGIGWYRKSLDVNEAELGKSFEIIFDGIYMNSEVWCNGHSLGVRPYGYISIRYDLTPYLKAGPNTIAVRVDNSIEPSSRWYNGAGIYSHVHLLRREQVQLPSWGVFVTTPTIEEEQASVEISAEVINLSKSSSFTVENKIFDPAGDMVAENSSTFSLPRGEKGNESQKMVVPTPNLWSLESPSLYTAQTRVWDGEILMDECTTTFGIRTIECDADRGFFINGKSIKLQGVCNHHDAGSVGAAVPEKVLERRLRILKEMGCNTIRTAHNPLPPAFYKLCDSMGIMVMDEIFDGWKEKGENDYGKRFFADWWKKDVEDWVRRDRNHACVVMWSIGNETGVHDEHNISGWIKSFDPSRVVTGGDVHTGVDVSGFNGKAEMPEFLEEFKKNHPHQPIVLTEVPHTYQTRGFYRTLNWWRDINQPRFDIPSLGEEQIFFGGHMKYSSSYDNSGIRMCARTSWKRTSENDWIMGEFRWTGFDYLGETFPGSGWPTRFWSHGIIDLCGFPKDHYYLYQSFWAEKEMVHVLPHWTHPGLEGTEIPVVAYSNCEKVELFLNGKSLGIQERGELLDFNWKVPYESGEIKVIAYKGNEAVAEDCKRTAGVPSNLLMISDNKELLNDKKDISHLGFSIRDDRGTLIPWANDPVHFELKGPVRHLGFENGNHLDLTPHRVNHRDLFHGRGLGIFQATAEDGPIEITAASLAGNPLFTETTTVSFLQSRISLRGDLENSELKIRYTLDGSEPNLSSTEADGPISIEQDTTVKAILVRDGETVLELSREFKKGEQEPVTDPRLLLPNGKSSVEVEGFVGPFSEQIVGVWRLWRRRLQFKADGTIVEEFRADGRPARGDDPVAGTSVTAYWWYDYPQDIFENPDNKGKGEIRWLGFGGETLQLELSSLDEDALLTMPDCTHLADLIREN
jgi:beta-galactosidase